MAKTLSSELPYIYLYSHKVSYTDTEKDNKNIHKEYNTITDNTRIYLHYVHKLNKP